MSVQLNTGQQQPCIPSLSHVWSDYQKTGRLKKRTTENYEQRLNSHLRDWLFLPVTAITKDMVEERHREVSLRGKPLANSVFRTLRALMSFAEVKYVDDAGDPIIKKNPVKRLSEVRAWHREKRRTRVIRPQQFRAWFRAVFSMTNTTHRDILIFLLLTGLRSCEAKAMKWDACDLEAGVVMIRDTKNGDDFQLPLSNYVWQLLSIRKLGATSDYVFPGRVKGRPTVLGRKIYRVVCADSGIEFSPHDLRRSFLTVADELDLKTEVVKALVNHRSRDVTEGYTIRSIERLRRASQRITDAILHYGGIRKADNLG